MRLLFLSNTYPPHDLGGYEQWCQEITDRLRVRGHHVQVLTSRFRHNSSAGSDLDVRRTLHMQADVYHYHVKDYFTRRRRQEQENRTEITQVLASTKPDLAVVWGMWNLSRNLPYWLEQALPGRVAYYVSSYWPQDADIHVEYWQLPAGNAASNALKRPLRSLALRQLQQESYPPHLRFEHVQCCSAYVRDTLVAAGKVPSSAGVLFGGIDPEPFLRNTATMDYDGRRPLRLLYFGSVLPQKGVHTAIEALGLLQRQGLAGKATLTILGSGHPDYEAELHARVQEFQLTEQVQFAGRVPRGEIPEWLGRFDVFLFTSIWPEPMARTVMEAMAAGLVVIGSRVGGQVEMLCDGVNGLTYAPGDAAGLAGQVRRVVENPALLATLAAAGRQMVLRDFTLDRMVDNLERWFESSLLSLHPGAHGE